MLQSQLLPRRNPFAVGESAADLNYGVGPGHGRH
jgi:hypothetical protein